jgi:hypothetical protein
MATEVKHAATELQLNNKELLQFILDMLPAEPDTILHVRDTEIGVHKALLSAHSKVFKAMFNGKFEQKHEIDRDPVIFQKFIDILYFKIVILTPDEELEMIPLLDYYGMTALHEKMETEFCACKLTPANAYRAYKCVILKKNKDVCRKKIIDYLEGKDGDTVIKTIDSVDDMYSFLKDEECCYAAAIASIIFWKKINNCEDGYAKLLTLIDLDALSLANLIMVINEKMFSSDVLLKILTTKVQNAINNGDIDGHLVCDADDDE